MGRFAGEVTFKCNGKIASQNKIDTKIDIDSNNQKIITASLTVQGGMRRRDSGQIPNVQQSGSRARESVSRSKVQDGQVQRALPQTGNGLPLAQRRQSGH